MALEEVGHLNLEESHVSLKNNLVSSLGVQYDQTLYSNTINVSFINLFCYVSLPHNWSYQLPALLKLAIYPFIKGKQPHQQDNVYNAIKPGYLV